VLTNFSRHSSRAFQVGHAHQTKLISRRYIEFCIVPPKCRELSRQRGACARPNDSQSATLLLTFAISSGHVITFLYILETHFRFPLALYFFSWRPMLLFFVFPKWFSQSRYWHLQYKFVSNERKKILALFVFLQEAGQKEQVIGLAKNLGGDSMETKSLLYWSARLLFFLGQFLSLFTSLLYCRISVLLVFNPVLSSRVSNY
jgi:hypothetical protein